MTSDSQSRAAEVILQRREIRRDLTKWALANDFTPAKHHAFIISRLEAVARGEIKRLIMLVPPGSAKSTYTSFLFPPWFLAQRPGNCILSCSYSATLAERFGKRCRNLIEQKSNLLGYTLSDHSQAAGDWATSTGSTYFAAGVGSGIAGHRADLGLIDDYLGSEQDADSEVIRDSQEAWYYNDFYPRLKPQASQVIIANRRHEDDLVGRLLAKEGEKWTVIRLPMLAEDSDPLGRAPGDLLWPEWYTQEMVATAKSVPRMWAGLYQQRPRPDEGNFFQAKSLMGYNLSELPTNLRYYAGSDWAVRKQSLADRTCHIIGGLDDNGRLWILPNWFWQKADTGTSVDAMFRLQKQYSPLTWWHGRENITGAIGPFVSLRMREENTYISIRELSEAKHKETKAGAIKARMDAGMVMFPKFAPDWADVENELLTFPGGTNDDWVDALGKFGQGLAAMVPANKVKREWDGIIPEQRLTCGWVEKSSRRRERVLARN